jgi:hypothetical protein
VINFTELVKNDGRTRFVPDFPRRAAPRPCPRGFSTDTTRTDALLAALDRVPEGREVRNGVPNLAATHVCFGPAAVSALTSDGVALLDAALGDEEAAARLGHLFVHVKRGSPLVLPEDRAACDAAVERALAAEAEALALELGLRRALGVRVPKIAYAFEEPFWKAEPRARTELVLAYLRAHPDGAPGIDALASGYARRCREARP